MVAVRAPVACVPEVALLPDQPPEAVQELALLTDQLKVEGLPLATVVGVAVKEMAGAGVAAFTVTVTERVTVPPLPLQLKV